MHGDIGLSSSAGKGTSAYFTLPFKKARNDLLKPNFDSVPERLQSDTSVKIVAHNRTPDSPKKHQRLPSSPPPEGTVSPYESDFSLSPKFPSDMEARRKCHVLVVDDSKFSISLSLSTSQQCCRRDQPANCDPAHQEA